MEKKVDQNEFAVVNDGAKVVDDSKVTVRVKKYTDRRRFEYRYDKSEETHMIMRDIAYRIYKKFSKIDGAYQILVMNQGAKATEYLMVIAKCKITHIIEMDQYNNLVDTFI